MSFLDQLKNQAQALQSERSAHQQRVEESTQRTEQACRLVLAYWQDLARQLTVLEPPGPPLSLDGRTPWPAMKLVDFRVDARRKMLHDREACDYIAMGWRIVPQLGEPVTAVVRVNFPTDMRRVEDRLMMGPVQHERRDIRDADKGALQEVRYEHLTQTRGSVLATPDHERGVIEFRLLNTAGFEVVHTRWPVTQVDTALMDELAKRIVGQPSRFA